MPVLVGAATFERKPDEGVAFVIDMTERKRAEERCARARSAFAICRNGLRLALGDRAGSSGRQYIGAH